MSNTPLHKTLVHEIEECERELKVAESRVTVVKPKGHSREHCQLLYTIAAVLS